eukprot:5658664-Amphidinium_carterae.1
MPLMRPEGWLYQHLLCCKLSSLFSPSSSGLLWLPVWHPQALAMATSFFVRLFLFAFCRSSNSQVASLAQWPRLQHNVEKQLLEKRTAQDKRRRMPKKAKKGGGGKGSKEARRKEDKRTNRASTKATDYGLATRNGAATIFGLATVRRPKCSRTSINPLHKTSSITYLSSGFADRCTVRLMLHACCPICLVALCHLGHNLVVANLGPTSTAQQWRHGRNSLPKCFSVLGQHMEQRPRIQFNC